MNNVISENEITDEILDKYIEEMREALGDEGQISNLITFDLERIKEGEVEKGRAGMLRWFKGGLARENKLLCGKCGEVMAIYYTAQCFNCKDPKEVIDKDGVINVYEACMIVDKKEKDFCQRDFLDSVAGLFGGNDSYSKIFFDKYDKNHTLMNKYFESGKLWFISW